ncbi:hypothetical protein BIWAKO_06410 [Bosea sp. BIWAKO-01]|nr:hypothetical protein BIWAKO_06410 [Bosea sp. BIWAKO-01]
MFTALRPDRPTHRGDLDQHDRTISVLLAAGFPPRSSDVFTGQKEARRSGRALNQSGWSRFSAARLAIGYVPVI